MEEEIIESRYEREKRKREQRKAQQQQDLEVPFARRFEIRQKDALNSGLTMIDDAMKAKKERYTMLVAKHANKYKWAVELYKQRKHREKLNGCID